jgi:2,3-dihydroxybenzoate decarboxylase
MAAKPYIVALEEHYQDSEVRGLTGAPGTGGSPGGLEERLNDLGGLRLKEMDEAGIDLQVLSHSIPGLQGVDAESGPALARRVNDRLHQAVMAHPDRFAAFAALPTADPHAAADELERTVTKRGNAG